MSQVRPSPRWGSPSPGWPEPPPLIGGWGPAQPERGHVARTSSDPWDAWDPWTPPSGQPRVGRRGGGGPPNWSGSQPAHRPARLRPRPPIPPGEYDDLDDFHDPDRRRRATNPGVWLIIVGLIALAAAAGAVVGGSGRAGDTVATGNGTEPGALSPEQTVIAYFGALDGMDCPAAIDLLSERSWQPGGRFASAEEAAAGCTSGALLQQTPTLSIDDVRVLSREGETVVVSVSGTRDGQPQTLLLTLVLDGGEWKVDLSNGSGAPPADGSAEPAPPTSPPTTLDPGAPAPTTPTTAPGSPPPDPTEAATAVRAFYDAMIAQDCPALAGMTTPNFWASLVTGSDPTNPTAVCDSAFANGYLTGDISVQDVVLDRHEGATATFSVPLTLGLDGTSYTEYVDLVFDAGVWKVNLIY